MDPDLNKGRPHKGPTKRLLTGILPNRTCRRKRTSGGSEKKKMEEAEDNKNGTGIRKQTKNTETIG